MPAKRQTTKLLRKQPAMAPAPDLSKALEGIENSIDELRHLENVADNLGELGNALHSLMRVNALKLLAEHGSEEDRAKVLQLTKRWFFYDEFPES